LVVLGFGGRWIEDEVAMTAAGADLIVCHMGLTTGGAIGAGTAKTLEGCVPLIDAWAAAELDVRAHVLVLGRGADRSSGPVGRATASMARARSSACRPRLR
jgi:predicted TIM-barrel enzyme